MLSLLFPFVEFIDKEIITVANKGSRCTTTFSGGRL
jgi:hypothetical protein